MLPVEEDYEPLRVESVGAHEPEWALSPQSLGAPPTIRLVLYSSVAVPCFIGRSAVAGRCDALEATAEATRLEAVPQLACFLDDSRLSSDSRIRGVMADALSCVWDADVGSSRRGVPLEAWLSAVEKIRRRARALSVGHLLPRQPPPSLLPSPRDAPLADNVQMDCHAGCSVLESSNTLPMAASMPSSVQARTVACSQSVLVVHEPTTVQELCTSQNGTSMSWQSEAAQGLASGSVHLFPGFPKLPPLLPLPPLPISSGSVASSGCCSLPSASSAALGDLTVHFKERQPGGAQDLQAEVSSCENAKLASKSASDERVLGLPMPTGLYERTLPILQLSEKPAFKAAPKLLCQARSAALATAAATSKWGGPPTSGQV
eukprot:TRINITY_DN23879_c0_g1_i2.p1 TRINITY_DN23879_c0_g1~~TRINITY_DN23879_c0_g1_i2.p1  ORF type:complete len:424 (-),score=62.56 TRINITY_DN23879_c0_g1_i2:86-1210(-)